MGGSFAQSASCHGGKRASWRQQIQDWLIAACQSVKILVRALRPGPLSVARRSATGLAGRICSNFSRLRHFLVEVVRPLIPHAARLAPLR
jgi:hypothetical protein